MEANKPSKAEYHKMLRHSGILDIIVPVMEMAVMFAEDAPREVRSAAIELGKRCETFLKHLKHNSGDDLVLVYELARVLEQSRHFDHIAKRTYVNDGLIYSRRRQLGAATMREKGDARRVEIRQVWSALMRGAVAVGSLTEKEAWQQLNARYGRSAVNRARIKSPRASRR